MITGLSDLENLIFQNNLYKIKKKYSNIILLDGDVLRKIKNKKNRFFSNSYRTKTI